MIPGEMVIEKVHGLQCTGISLSDRFAMMTAEHIGKVARPRRRAVIGYQRPRIYTWLLPNQNTLRMSQAVTRQQPIKQRLGMPGLRRFGSDGNLPGLRRSNSFGNLSQFRNRIPWRQSNGNLSKAGSVSSLSQASWHGRSTSVNRGRRPGQLRGRLRGRGRQQGWQQIGKFRAQQRGWGVANAQGQRGGFRGTGKGRGGFQRNQQNRNQQNRNQQNRNQLPKNVPTKEELDAQLDEYMATSHLALDRELDDYMLKASRMELE